MKKQNLHILLSSFVFILIIFLSKTTFGQPAIQWQKCFGGDSTDNVYSIQQTFDSGYVVAGFSMSNNGEVGGNFGDKDFWVVKMNNQGDLQWQKNLGGSNQDWAYSIKQTIDNGYIIAGLTNSIDSMVSGNHGMQDVWVVKLGNSGEFEWQKCLGGSNNDVAYSIQQTYDTGFIVVGGASSNDGDVTVMHGIGDYWIVKLNSLGAIQWQKSLGGSSGECAFSVQQTRDSGYIVAGRSQSNNGDANGSHGNDDCWIVKLNNNGDVQWKKCYGGSQRDVARDIKQTKDGGYIFAGSTNSNDGDVSGLHTQWNNDFWVVKISDNGVIQWQKCLGGDSVDDAYSIQQTPDGSYIVAGTTSSSDGDVTGLIGVENTWIVKLDSSGSIRWEKCYGGSATDLSNATWLTFDGGIISTGCTNSNDGDVSGNHGGWDYWVVKLADDSYVQENKTDFLIQIFPNPATTSITIQTPQASTIEIFNLEGQILRTIKQTELKTSIDVSQLPAGIYFIRATSEKGADVRKFVKEVIGKR